MITDNFVFVAAIFISRSSAYGVLLLCFHENAAKLRVGMLGPLSIPGGFVGWLGHHPASGLDPWTCWVACLAWHY